MENSLAFIYGNIEISWFAVFVTLGCFAGIALACILRKLQKAMLSDIFILTTLAVPLALIFSRLQYCIFSSHSFNNIWEMLNFANGGYGLYGAILGVVIAAFIVNKRFDMGGAGKLLDCAAIGSLIPITMGRFATHFTGTEIGYEVSFETFTVYDAEGQINNLAVYMLDGIVSAMIFVICLGFFIKHFNKSIDGKTSSDGKTALVMLALHGTNQVVMDSMRSDALKLGANDFIKISQIIGIVCCVAVVVYFIVKTIINESFRLYHAVIITALPVCVALGVYSEYRVGNGNYISKHILMAACMLALAHIVVWLGARTINPVPKATASAEDDKSTISPICENEADTSAAASSAE